MQLALNKALALELLFVLTAALALKFLLYDSSAVVAPLTDLCDAPPVVLRQPWEKVIDLVHLATSAFFYLAVIP